VARSLRLVFLGNDRWSVPSLRALAASDHDIVRALTRVPRPAGRGNALTPTPVANAAREAALPLLEVETVKGGPGLYALRSDAPEVLVVVAYGEILPQEVLEVPTVAPVNLHFSLLPRLRGASPVQTALLEGAEETGVTTIMIDAGMDTGPVFVQRPEPVRPDDDAGSLGDRLAEIGAGVLVETLDRLAEGDAEPTPQDDSRATSTSPIRAEDRILRWGEPARALVNRTRAMAPEPGASTALRGESLKVLRAETTDARGEPGTIATVDADGFVVATADGGFRPLEVAPAGRKRMRAADFVNGYRPEVGERLG
jgi:methionyl-tRNA formyltransferase